MTLRAVLPLLLLLAACGSEVPDPAATSCDRCLVQAYDCRGLEGLEDAVCQRDNLTWAAACRRECVPTETHRQDPHLADHFACRAEAYDALGDCLSAPHTRLEQCQRDHADSTAECWRAL